jgi:hypothetical protein
MVNCLRQHRDTREVLAVARVFGEPGKIQVCLSPGHSRPPVEGLHYYGSREIACAAADVLARHHLVDHECSTSSCSGWM